MIRSLALIALLGLTACAETSPPKVAVCDGKHLRPANLYGSVLQETPLDTPAAAALSSPKPKTGATSPSLSPAPATKPPAISRIDPMSYAPCGRLA